MSTQDQSDCVLSHLGKRIAELREHADLGKKLLVDSTPKDGSTNLRLDRNREGGCSKDSESLR